MMTRASWRFEAIGTIWEIVTPEKLTGDHRTVVTRVIAEFDHAWSRFRGDSVVTQIARGERSQGAIPEWASDGPAMLSLYDDLDRATSGAVNPFVGESLARRGYDATYSFSDRGATATRHDWRDALRCTERGVQIRTDATPLVDVGALGKGRLVDLIFTALADLPGPIVVDAGGDLRVRGATERVGLEHPYDASRAIGVWPLREGALCASATNRRAWGDGLHHVIDARTGEPVRSVVATWAWAADAMTADAAATALFFDGGVRFTEKHGVSWVRMTSSGQVDVSDGCPAQLFRRSTRA